MSERLSDVSGVVYGVPVHGRLPAGFRRHLWPGPDGSGRAAQGLALSYETVDAVPALDGVWESEAEGPGGTVDRFTLSRLPAGFALAVAGAARGLFRCTQEGIHVQWAGPVGAAPHYLFAYALPLWLEARGVPVLHGSAVTLGERVVGFLAPSGTGKSVLCAELLRLGCGFVADDGLAVARGPDGGWHCLPGPPLLRLWPSGLAGRLEIAPEVLPRVRADGDKRSLPLERVAPVGADGLLSGGAQPEDGDRLAAFYVLRRRAEVEGPVELTGLRPREALVRLLEHGVAAAPAAVLGLAPRRLETLADLAETVPVRQLAFPSGPDSAARVLAAIERELAGRPG